MKTNRIRRYSSTISGTVKSQKRDRRLQFPAVPLNKNKHHLSSGPRDTVIIVFRDEVTGRELDRVELQTAFFFRIRHAAKAMGITVSSFFCDVIAEVVGKPTLSAYGKGGAK
jgi:hypothetical protein